jgi:hypothetical protein
MSEIIWTPPEPPEWKPTCPADYIDPCGHWFFPANRRGCLSIKVLPELTGYPWNEISMGYVQGLRPSILRVVKGEETTDSWLWRVTVCLDDEDKIRMIAQEVSTENSSLGHIPTSTNCSRISLNTRSRTRTGRSAFIGTLDFPDLDKDEQKLKMDHSSQTKVPSQKV